MQMFQREKIYMKNQTLFSETNKKIFEKVICCNSTQDAATLLSTSFRKSFFCVAHCSEEVD